MKWIDVCSSVCCRLKTQWNGVRFLIFFFFSVFMSLYHPSFHWKLKIFECNSECKIVRLAVQQSFYVIKICEFTLAIDVPQMSVQHSPLISILITEFLWTRRRTRLWSYYIFVWIWIKSRFALHLLFRIDLISVERSRNGLEIQCCVHFVRFFPCEWIEDSMKDKVNNIKF